jgi:hypothetical protein
MNRRPQDTSAEEPNGGNPHIRLRGGPRQGDRPGLLNKTLAGFLLVIVGVVAISRAFGERAPSRPPGIPANRWVSVNEQLGIVLILPNAQDSKPQVAPHAADPAILLVGPPSYGYFMFRRGDVWTRLSVAERPGDAW